MRSLFGVFVLLCSLLHSATYDSITSHDDKNGISGFKSQMEYVPDSTLGMTYDFEMEGVRYTVPYMPTRLYPESYDEAVATSISNLVWCNNGMRRFKIYMPAGTSYYNITFVALQSTTYLAYATFRPDENTGIDHLNAKSYNSQRDMYTALFTNGETVVFKIEHNYQITIDSFITKYYGLDISHGGYLYFGVAQAPNLFTSTNPYYAKFQFSVSLNMSFNEVSDDYMQSIIDDANVPYGGQEPYEPDSFEITNECSGSEKIELVTEYGLVLTPQESCELTTGNVWIYETCYSAEEYACEIDTPAPGVWDDDESRCISQDEQACTGSDEKWYIAGDACLPVEQTASATISNSTAESAVMQYSSYNDGEVRELAVLEPYYANDEGWSSLVEIRNDDATTFEGEIILMLDGSYLTLLPISVSAGSTWEGSIAIDSNGQYVIHYNDTSHSFTANGDGGRVIVVPKNTTFGQQSFSLSTYWTEPDDNPCADGQYYNPVTETCADLYSSSSVAYSSVAVSSYAYSSADSTSQCEDDEYFDETTGTCESCDDGEFYSVFYQACKPIGGYSSSSKKSSSSSVDTSSSVASSAVSSANSSESDGCDSPFPTDECYTTSSSSILSSASSVSSTSSESAVQTSDEALLEEHLLDNNYTINGYFIAYDFEESPVHFDYAYVSLDANGAVYQMNGVEPSETNIFGFALRSDISIDASIAIWAMANIDESWKEGSDPAYNWVVVGLFDGSVYKLVGVDDDGTFKYSSQLDIIATEEDKVLSFSR